MQDAMGVNSSHVTPHRSDCPWGPPVSCLQACVRLGSAPVQLISTLLFGTANHTSDFILIFSEIVYFKPFFA